MEAMRVGDPMKEDTDIARLAPFGMVEQLEPRSSRHLRGRRILTGGERMVGEGNYFEPTLVTGVPRNSSVYGEELFGRVAMLFRVQDVNEAVEIANDIPFGLAVSAWTRDPSNRSSSSSFCNAAASFSMQWLPAIPGCPSEASSVPAMVANSLPPESRAPQRKDCRDRLSGTRPAYLLSVQRSPHHPISPPNTRRLFSAKLRCRCEVVVVI